MSTVTGFDSPGGLPVGNLGDVVVSEGPTMEVPALANKCDVVHAHALEDVTDLDAALAAKSDLGHTHPGGDGVPTGCVLAWVTAAAPAGYLLCDGAAVSRVTFAVLFAVIGTIYGAGNGSTTFNVPNLRGRVPVGFDSGQAEFDALAEAGGAKTVTLTAAEMPAHTHVQDAHNHTQNPHSHGMAEGQTDGAGTFMDRSNAASATTATTDAATATNNATTAVNQSTGGDAAHANLPPYLVVNYIVKT